MTPKQTAEKLAAELGVTLEVGGGRYFEIVADSPPGMVFNSCGLHCTVSSTNGETTSTAVWRGVVEDLKLGVSPCTYTDCEYCHPEI